ncbi:hypothetical protein PM082_022467 [Marasmius tenuissimus]|nr:hypothetical protein PM082_022467 [Marasmius tenuissimus]
MDFPRYGLITQVTELRRITDDRSVWLRNALLMFIAYALANAFLNLLLTLMIGSLLPIKFVAISQPLSFFLAVRIYRATQPSRDFWGQVDNFYRTLIVIIVESGVLYPIALFVYVFSPYQTIVYFSLVQIVGIAPTLIMVRTGLGAGDRGQAMNDLESFHASPSASGAGSARRTRTHESVHTPSVTRDIEVGRASLNDDYGHEDLSPSQEKAFQ